MKNQAGIITIDFLISLMIASVFCTVLFIFTFTFTVIEISQYIAFSTSRAFIAGHLTTSDQERLATNKFNQFLGKGGNPELLPLFQNGWYELSKPDIRGAGESGRSFESDYGNPDGVNSSYTGVRLIFNAKLLMLNFGFLGSTSKSGDGFLANVTGLMIREPTTEECKKQFTRDNRYRAILDLDPRFNNYRTTSDKYLEMEDNGC